MTEQISQPFDLLLGRRTFEIFAGYRPQQDAGEGINKATKYVASTTLTQHAWEKSDCPQWRRGGGDQNAQAGPGPQPAIHGSGTLIQTLLAHDLVDEFWLKIFPVTLGRASACSTGARSAGRLYRRQLANSSRQA